MTDAQLRRFAASFRSGILGPHRSAWMCFAVAAPLRGLLRAHGIEAELVESDLGAMNHFWLKLPDGRALDPTADQFAGLDLPPVYLGEPHPVIHPEPESPEA